MHLNSHLAAGTSIALAMTMAIEAALPVEFGGIEILIMALAGCAPDGDFLFSSKAPHENHRFLITHSFYPGIAVLALGIVVLIIGTPALATGWVILVAGLNLIIHVMLDSIDWGVDVFHRGRLKGLKTCYSGLAVDEFHERATNSATARGYYFNTYFHNKLMIALEVALAAVMFTVIGISWGASDSIPLASILLIIIFGSLLGLHAVSQVKGKKLLDQSERGNEREVV